LWAVGGDAWGQSRTAIHSPRSRLGFDVTFFDSADVYGCGHSEKL